MTDLSERILAALARKGYHPVKPKVLARRIGVPSEQYADFRRALRELLHQGRVQMGKNHVVKPGGGDGQATVAGTYRKSPGASYGYVRPHSIDGKASLEIRVRADDALDAVTGDNVLVKIIRKARDERGPIGRIVQVIERATRQFVGTYFERDGEGYVRIDGTVFSHSVYVGDPGAKGARKDDKVVVEMIRFPSPDDRGEAVITEVLGPHGKPGVDTLSIIRAYNLPDEFPDLVKEEARQVAARFDEAVMPGRADFTGDLVITIDPVDARDFDDAVSLVRDDATGHWTLGVHIADVGHFAPVGSELDREARKRATSVYLPQKVIPMFPELLSNGLASLQEGKNRCVKSVHISYTPEGQKTGVVFANGVIRNKKRLTYEQASALYAAYDKGAGKASGQRKGKARRKSAGEAPPDVSPEVLDLLLRMRELAMILRRRRKKRGSLELTMPAAELEFDSEGKVSGAHFASHDVSHQVIEEFMLAANEAVAEHLDSLDIAFLRRIHPAPEPNKLKAFAGFARSLGYKVDLSRDRFALQEVLERSADRPEVYAVHYALLRSLKQAVYSPEEEGHYALALEDYCHFTSPIRRYPDLTVHRLLDQYLQRGKVGSDETEMAAIGEHCSKMERRAETAERELIKLRLLTYMSERLGMEMEAIITGVADYGFFAQAETLPVEGLVHISTLTDDYYYYDEDAHTLSGRRTKNRYRLGDKVWVKVVRVDMQRRQLDFRVALRKKKSEPRA